MNRTLRPRNLKLALRAESGLSLGEIYPLTQSRNVIGRRVDAAVPIDDARASRNHASIDVQNGFHYLVDLGSTNGTYLNGRKLERGAAVSVGDEVRIGSLVLRVTLLEQAKAQVGKTWKEATRAVLRESIVGPAAVAAELSEPSDERWRKLIPASGESRMPLPWSRWLTFGACGILIVAAIATTLSR